MDLIQINKGEDAYSIFSKNVFSGFPREALIAEKAKAEVIISKPSTRSYIHQLEDNEAIQGNIANFKLSSNDIIAKITAFCQIWDNKTDNSLIVRAFLTVGDYSVETHENSFHGKIRYFGSPNYWNRILTTPDENIAMNLDKFLKQYSGSFGETSDKKLQYLVDNFQAKTRDWRYYFIKYDSITQDYCGKLNLFNLFTWGCVNGFDINGLGNSGKQPLHSYHLNPHLICVKNYFGKYDKVELFENRFSVWSCLVVNSKMRIYCCSAGWQIYLDSKELSKDLVEKFKIKRLKYEDTVYFLLSASPERDNIEILVDFIHDFLKK